MGARKGRREAPLDAERERACIAAAGLLWAALSLALVGRLKVRRRWRAGDTRKLFHLLIFAGAALVQRRAQIQGTLAYGVAVSAVVAVAVVRGPGHPATRRSARESDAPHRTWYVVVPWFATALGGVLANLLFPQHATFGYLVVGLADAVGEPIGIQFGRHRYRVPLPAKGSSRRAASRARQRSSWRRVSRAIALALAEFHSKRRRSEALLFAAACTLVEAAAPHGWDNLLLSWRARRRWDSGRDDEPQTGPGAWTGGQWSFVRAVVGVCADRADRRVGDRGPDERRRRRSDRRARQVAAAALALGAWTRVRCPLVLQWKSAPSWLVYNTVRDLPLLAFVLAPAAAIVRGAVASIPTADGGCRRSCRDLLVLHRAARAVPRRAAVPVDEACDRRRAG